MSRYKLKKEFAHLSDEEILAVLLRADQIARDKGVSLKFHPGEKEHVEKFLSNPKKLERFLGGEEQYRTEALALIRRLLNRPVEAEDP